MFYFYHRWKILPFYLQLLIVFSKVFPFQPCILLFLIKSWFSFQLTRIVLSPEIYYCYHTHLSDFLAIVCLFLLHLRNAFLVLFIFTFFTCTWGRITISRSEVISSSGYQPSRWDEEGRFRVNRDMNCWEEDDGLSQNCYIQPEVVHFASD